MQGFEEVPGSGAKMFTIEPTLLISIDYDLFFFIDGWGWEKCIANIDSMAVVQNLK